MKRHVGYVPAPPADPERSIVVEAIVDSTIWTRDPGVRGREHDLMRMACALHLAAAYEERDGMADFAGDLHRYAVDVADRVMGGLASASDLTPATADVFPPRTLP